MLKSIFKIARIVVPLLIIAAVGVSWFFIARRQRTQPRDARVDAWIRDPAAHADWATPTGSQCLGYPFQFPTRGFIGYLYDDSLSLGKRHSGIDIFGGEKPGVAPIYAAYPGLLTRLPGWKSSVIVRIPTDPVESDRTIWTYYTHMADEQGNSLIDAAFPAGVTEVPIKAGTLLGHMGNYSGAPGEPVGVHLHFSIVLSKNEKEFKDERDIANTVDPSPYFGLPLNANKVKSEVATCK